ncbi:MAG: nucleotidyltransferase family protein, partial [Oscillibacter sp.]|nr:nucleotidyltransferase family protein [Oscillibacter sp.]
HNLAQGQWEPIVPYLIPGGREVLEGSSLGFARLERVERAMLARVRTMSVEDWAALPDSGQAEGLPRRLEKAGQQCTSMDEFYDLVKTKRYTHARLRRLALWAYLGLTAGQIPNTPPYLRVLGFNRRGQAILKEMKQTASLPLITKPAQARDLDERGRTLFELEARFTDLYDLCLEQIPAPGREWRQNPAISTSL